MGHGGGGGGVGHGGGGGGGMGHGGGGGGGLGDGGGTDIASSREEKAAEPAQSGEHGETVDCSGS